MNTTSNITVKLQKEKFNRSWEVKSWEEAARQAEQFQESNISFEVELEDGDDIVPIKITELNEFMYQNDWDLGSRDQIGKVLKTLKKRVRELEALLELSPDQYQSLIEGFDRARFGDDYD